MESTLLKNNSIEDSVGNEENEYPVSDPPPQNNETYKMSLRRPMTLIKKSLMEEILGEITEKLLEKILDTVNPNV
jgi:hypothetical protein